MFEGFDLQIDEEKWKDISLRTTGFNLEEFIKLAKNAQFILYNKQKRGEEAQDHFKIVKSCLSLTKPINLTFSANTPNVKWTDIGGYSQVKATINRVVELPMRNPELFKKRGIKPSKVPLDSAGHPLLRSAWLLENALRKGAGDRVFLQLHLGERTRGLQQVRGRLGESDPRHLHEGEAELPLHHLLRRDRLAGVCSGQEVGSGHAARKSATEC